MEQTKDLDFHCDAIAPENAHTAVLLLKSHEPEIIFQILRAITKYSTQDMINRNVLYNLNAIRYILPHVEHSELNIRRFALKALAQLCELPEARKQVLVDSQNLRKIANMLIKIEDIFVLEFASLVLSELTLEPLGCNQLVSANILSTLLSRMKNSVDPDVQRNCLQTLSNLLDDPVCASKVTRNYQFSWPSLLALMQSKYVAIQHAALRTVNHIICHYKDEVAQKTFRSSTGVLDLCDILQSYEFRDVHAVVLTVLRNYVETEANAAHLHQSGCLLRLLAYLETASPAVNSHCLAVLTKMSFTSNGRDALYQTGADLVFCQQLFRYDDKVLADAAMGVANMTKLVPSAVRMFDMDIIGKLSDIITNKTAVWFYIKMNALRALEELCRIIPKAASSLAESKAFAALRSIYIKFKDNPIEAQRLAIQCCINLENFNVGTKAMLNADFVLEILSIVQRPDISLKKMACILLTGLTEEDVDAKELFTYCKGEEMVAEHLLNSKNIGFLTALCTLITASVSDKGANEYLRLGTIHYMVENRLARYVVSAWEPALEAIFRHHTSAKLAYTGRLEINDYTQEGFYVQKRLSSPFPTIQSLMEQPPPYNHPTFICAFQTPLSVSSSTIKDDIKTPHRQSSWRLTSSSSQLLLSKYQLTTNDVNLRSYFHRQRVYFGDTPKSLLYIKMYDSNYEMRCRDKCEEVSTSMKERAGMLAEFVAEQMCGINQDTNCFVNTVSLHLADLMTDFDSCVIGLGWVKYGGALERAVLYKVLADRLGLPCALHRKSSGHAWCEVAVPEEVLDTANPDKPENYPVGLLRSNYVVDLTVQPGRLLLRDSHEAKLLCGPSCAPPYTARAKPDACCTPPSQEAQKLCFSLTSNFVGY